MTKEKIEYQPDYSKDLTFIGKMRRKEKFHLDISDRKFSDVKGYIGEIIASQFFRAYFKKLILPFNILPLLQPKDKDELYCLVSPWKEYSRRCKRPSYTTSEYCKELGMKEPKTDEWYQFVRIIDKDELRHKLYSENLNKVIKFFRDFRNKYHPDFFLAIDGKLNIIEVKIHKAVLHINQRKDLEKMKNCGFPVYVLYIKMKSFTEYDVDLEKI